MKIKPSIKTEIITVTGLILFLTLTSFLVSFNWSTMTISLRNLYYIIAVFALSLIISVIYIIKMHYEFTNNEVIIHSLIKKVTIPYDALIYLNEEKSLKNNYITCYNYKGNTQYFINDKNHEIIKQLKKRCKFISKEEFSKRFPNIKL